MSKLYIKHGRSNDPVRILDLADSAYIKKGGGGPKKTQLGSIKNDLNFLGSNENMTLNRSHQRKVIHVADRMKLAKGLLLLFQGYRRN